MKQKALVAVSIMALLFIVTLIAVGGAGILAAAQYPHLMKEAMK